MWRIALCDDTCQDRAVSEKLIRKYGELNHLPVQVTQFDSGEKLLFACSEEGSCFDLIFLDVLMPQMDGIATALQIREKNPRIPILFLTTTRDYAVESYEVQAFDYLIKPLDARRLYHTLDRLQAQMNHPRIALQTRGGVHYFYYRDVMYFESHNHATFVHLSDGTELRCNESLQELCVLLAEDARFYHCHKGYLVNMDYIRQVDEVFFLTDGSRIPYRIREKKQVLDHYYQYYMASSLCSADAR
jgi:DNA-binding LytR/AlgR family response regulator